MFGGKIFIHKYSFIYKTTYNIQLMKKERVIMQSKIEHNEENKNICYICTFDILR